MVGALTVCYRASLFVDLLSCSTLPTSSFVPVPVPRTRTQPWGLFCCTRTHSPHLPAWLKFSWEGIDGQALRGGYGAITPGEAAEAPDAVTWPPPEVAHRVRIIAGLLVCSPTEAVAVIHRFPAILETPQSVIASRLAALKVRRCRLYN